MMVDLERDVESVMMMKKSQQDQPYWRLVEKAQVTLELSLKIQDFFLWLSSGVVCGGGVPLCVHATVLYASRALSSKNIILLL